MGYSRFADQGSTAAETASFLDDAKAQGFGDGPGCESIPVGDEIVRITQTFTYLGSVIHWSTTAKQKSIDDAWTNVFDAVDTRAKGQRFEFIGRWSSRSCCTLARHVTDRRAKTQTEHRDGHRQMAKNPFLEQHSLIFGCVVDQRKILITLIRNY